MKKLSFVLVLFFVGCASVASNFRDVLPLLAARTLLISKTKPGSLEYPYEVCVKRGPFGGCKETKAGVDYYDLSDPAVAAKLRDMNFEAKVRVEK
jgi:hypothetical protein